jgi:adenylate cyclase 1
MIKSLLLCAMALVYVLLIELSHKPLFSCFDHRVGNKVPLDIISVTVVVLFVIAVALHGRQVRLVFFFQIQSTLDIVNSNNSISYIQSYVIKSFP